MEPEIVEPTVRAIAAWSGVTLPNAAARHGLADMAGIITEIERLRGTYAFEDEPSSFEAALRDCREPQQEAGA